jgi:hypothetical protein
MKLVALVCSTGLSMVSLCSVRAQEMSPMEWGIDRPGSDVRSFTTARLDPNLCRDECAASAQCVAWSYVPMALPNCFLKNAAAVPVTNDDVVSGVKSERFVAIR